MQLSILTSILQSRVRYAAESRVLGQVQQQQINSVRCNNNTAINSLCVLCSRRCIVDYDVIYSSTYRRGLIRTQVLCLLKVMYTVSWCGLQVGDQWYTHSTNHPQCTVQSLVTERKRDYRQMPPEKKIRIRSVRCTSRL